MVALEKDLIEYKNEITNKIGFDVPAELREMKDRA